MDRIFNFKNLSLRVRIFLSMIFLTLIASILIAAVSIYQFRKEAKEYMDNYFNKFKLVRQYMDDIVKEGKEKGLGVIDGEVILLPTEMKIPHMGWNDIQIEKSSKILEGIPNGSWVYFVHSYRVKPKNDYVIVADSDYGVKVPAVVEYKNFFGTQFHPEKSGNIGSVMIGNFLRECKK